MDSHSNLSATPTDDSRVVPASSYAESSGRVLASRYMLLHLIGSGGMGQVYAALDMDLNRQVAIKLVRWCAPQDLGSTEFTGSSALLNEAQSQARITHPNVAAIFDVGREGEEIFLAMELIRGQNLRTWLAIQSRHWIHIAEIFEQAARGLHAAHYEGIFHRDFKPENVLLDESGRAYVADFGLALTNKNGLATTTVPERSISRRDTPPIHETTTTRVSGTPGYLAPEYYSEGYFDDRADQFAFGVALFESLYGRKPFPALGTIGSLERIQRGAQIPAAKRGVPRWMEKIVRRTLSYSPANRFDSLEAVAHAISAGLHRPQRQRRNATTFALLSTFIVGLAPFLSFESEQQCKQTTVSSSGVWNVRQQEQVQSQFRKSGASDYQAAFSTVSSKVGEQIKALDLAYLRLCEAHDSRVLGSTDDAHAWDVDAVASCLSQARSKTVGLISALTDADRAMVLEAPRASASLEDPHQCFQKTKADAKHRVDFGEGLDPTARAHVEALRGSMNELVGRAEVGQDVMALPEFMQLVRDIENSGSLALIAEAYRFVGERNLRASLPIEASRWMHAAYHAALRAGHSDVAVLSLAHLLRVHGYELQNQERALELTHELTAAYNAAGRPAALGIGVSSELGTAAAARRDYARALQHYEDALATSLQILPANHPRRAVQHINVAFAQIYLGESKLARDNLYLALDGAQRSLGDQHPNLPLIHHNLAVTHSNLGDSEKAIYHGRKALEICTAREVDPLQCAPTTAILAEFLVQRGRSQEAKAYLAKMAQLQEQAGRRGPAHAYWAHEALVVRIADDGDFAEAYAVAQRGLMLARRDPNAAIDFQAGLTMSEMTLRDRLRPNELTSADIDAALARFRGQTQYGIHTEANVFLSAARLLSYRGEFIAAKRIYDELLLRLAHEFSESHHFTYAANLGLISVLLELGEIEKAEALWQNMQREVDPELHCSVTLPQLQVQGALETALGKPQQALETAQAGLDCIDSQDNPAAFRRSPFFVIRAKAWLDPQNLSPAKARANLQQALDGYGQRSGFDRERQAIQSLLKSI